MYRLVFDGFSFEFLEGGKQGLVLEPRIGGQYIDPGAEARVVFRYRSSGPPSYRSGGGYIALYLLLYGDKVKVGTSSVFTVVERMYSQAPRAGIIAGVYGLSKPIPLEGFEKAVVEALGGRFGYLEIVDRKPHINHILKVRSFTVDEKTVSVLRDLARRVSNVLVDGASGSLYMPGEYWFTVPRGEDMDLGGAVQCKLDMLRSMCGERRCRGVLRVYRDAICRIEFGEPSTGKRCIYVNTCDWFAWNMVFYSVRV